MKKIVNLIFLLFAIEAYSQTWDTVGCGLYEYGARVSSLIEYKNELYVAGNFFFTGNHLKVNSIAKWNCRKWDSVGAGVYGDIHALKVYKNDLYAGGSFYRVGDRPIYKIAKWDGRNWNSVGSGMNHNQLHFAVNCMAVYNDELYVGGGFDTVDGRPANCIAKWDGASWDSVGTGIPNKYSIEVSAMIVYKDELYISTIIPGIMHDSCNIYCWDKKNWKVVYSGQGSIDALVVYNNDLYAGGKFIPYKNMTLPTGNLMKWESNKWIVMGKGFTNNGWDGNIACLTVFNHELYIGGAFDNVDTMKIKNIVKWNGKNFKRAGDEIFGNVSAMEVYKNNLYITGNLYTLHRKKLNSIAVLNRGNQ